MPLAAYPANRLGRVTETTPSATDPRAALRLRPEIAALPAYRQGKAAEADAFKLSSNENPFDPLPGVVDAVAAATAFNRYPDATALRLRTELAARHGVSPDEVHIGSGSVALLAQLVLATSGPGTEVVYSWRSFEAYPSLVTVSGAASVRVPNTPEHGHDLPAIAAAIGDATSLVIICSPNNPTGAVVGAEEFEAFMATVPSDVIVVLDEAYAEFVSAGSAAEPAAVNGLPRGSAPLTARHPNLVILRTFSKAYGLAARRLRDRFRDDPRCRPLHGDPTLRHGPGRDCGPGLARGREAVARAGAHDCGATRRDPRRAHRPGLGTPPVLRKLPLAAARRRDRGSSGAAERSRPRRARLRP